jgi:RNA polymerase sigma-70 factor (ECF subfamily)
MDEIAAAIHAGCREMGIAFSVTQIAFHKRMPYRVKYYRDPSGERFVPSGKEFDRLVKAYSAEIFAYLWRILQGYEDAEDCLQEVFLRAYQAFHRLRTDSNYRAWLYKIATHTAFSFRRKRTRHEGREVSIDLDQISGGHLPADQLEWKEHIAFLWEAIEKLPNRQRSALIMRKYQELSYEEISAILDCSQEAARANVYQALKKLRAGFYGEAETVE